MDLWTLMNQTQATRFASNRYPQYIPNKTFVGYGTQSLDSLYIGQHGLLPQTRFPVSAVTQAASLIPKQSTPTNLSLMNLVMENNLLKSQLQLLKPQKPEITKLNIDPTQIPTLNTYELNNMVQPQTSQEKKEQTGSQAKKKRYRRLAKQIERVNCCPVASCSKSYGSEGSLHQHIRLKHQDFDILTWIRDKIKNGEALQSNSKDSAESSKVDQSSNFSNQP